MSDDHVEPVGSVSSLVKVLIVVVVFSGYSLWQLLQPSFLDAFSAHNHFAHLTTPRFGNALLLLCVRLVCAAVSLATVAAIFFDKRSLEFRYFSNKVQLVRTGRWTTFTVQTFTLITIYFVGVSALSVASFFMTSSSSSSSLYQSVLSRVASLCTLLFELVFPVSFLVTIVVSFVLYPTAVRMKMEDAVGRLFLWPALVMHNANVIFLLAEFFLATPSFPHFSFAFLGVLFGLWYVVFSWYWYAKTGVYYYFFLDTRRPHAWTAYLALLATLGLAFGLRALIGYILDNGLWAYGALVWLFTYNICLFRDPRMVLAV